MTEKTPEQRAEQAKLDKLTKPTRSAKPELPANVVVSDLGNGLSLFNAVAE